MIPKSLTVSLPRPAMNGTLLRGKHTVSLRVLFDLDAKPLLTDDEMAKALELYAVQAGFVQRGEAHSRENAYKKAQADLAAFARGEIGEVPEDAPHLAERYYSIQSAVRYAHADWAKTSGIPEFCAPILKRALDAGEAKLKRMLEREEKVAHALQIPFVPSESALAVNNTVQDVRHAYNRVANFTHDEVTAVHVNHLLMAFVDWPV